MRARLDAAEAAARVKEEVAVAQQERLTAWVDRQERAAKRHAEVYQRLRSAHAADRGATPDDATSSMPMRLDLFKCRDHFISIVAHYKMLWRRLTKDVGQT